MFVLNTSRSIRCRNHVQWRAVQSFLSVATGRVRIRPPPCLCNFAACDKKGLLDKSSGCRETTLASEVWAGIPKWSVAVCLHLQHGIPGRVIYHYISFPGLTEGTSPAFESHLCLRAWEIVEEVWGKSVRKWKLQMLIEVSSPAKHGPEAITPELLRRARQCRTLKGFKNWSSWWKSEWKELWKREATNECIDNRHPRRLARRRTGGWGRSISLALVAEQLAVFVLEESKTGEVPGIST